MKKLCLCALMVFCACSGVDKIRNTDTLPTFNEKENNSVGCFEKGKFNERIENPRETLRPSSTVSNDFNNNFKTLNTHYEIEASPQVNSVHNWSNLRKNSRFEDAENITPKEGEIGFLESYNRKIVGKLGDFVGCTFSFNYEKNLIKDRYDVDFYEFFLDGNAKVTYRFSSVPSNTYYFIELYRFKNMPNANIHTLNPAKDYDYNNLTVEYISDYTNEIMKPGAYFFKIYSLDNKVNGLQNYTVSMTVEYDKGKDVSLANLKYNKGANAAMWISDFDPFGIAPFSNYTVNEVGTNDEVRSFSSAEDRFADGPILDRVSKIEGKIRHSTLYIWGKEFRRGLADLLLKIYNDKDKDLAKLTKQKTEIEAIENKVNGVLTGITIIVSITPVVGWLTGASALAGFATYSTVMNYVGKVNMVGKFVAEKIFKTITGSIDNQIQETQTFMTSLREAYLAISVSDHTSEEEVIKLDKYYSFKMEKGTAKIDFTHQLDINEDEIKYSGDTIYANPSKAYFGGHVYPIKEENDIEKARNRQTINLPDVNTSEIMPFDYNEKLNLYGAAGEIHGKGEYQWFSFTAPVAGKFTFVSFITPWNGKSLDPYGELFRNPVPGQSTDGRIDYNDDTNGRNFEVEIEMEEGETVYLRVRGYAWNSVGNYSLSVAIVNYFDLSIEHFDYIEKYNRYYAVGQIVCAGASEWFSFTAPEDGKYLFYSGLLYGSNLDPFGELFKAPVPGQSIEGRIDYNDGYASWAPDFEIEKEMNEGETVYLRVRGYDWVSTGSFDVSIMKIS